MKAVRVLIAHSNEAIAETLRTVIEADPRVAVVASARLGEDCVRKASISWPTVVVMDLAFPDMSAGRIIRQLSQARLPLAVLICSQSAVKGTPQLDLAVKEGAYDFILLPQDPAGIEKIGRQILTTIHVAGFSKTKMIPQVDPKVEVKAEQSLEAHSRLNCVVLDCASHHVQGMSWVLCRVHPQCEPAVLAVVRETAPSANELVKALGPKLHAQCDPYFDGAALQSGRILVLDEGKGDKDRVAEKDARGRTVLKEIPQENGRRGAHGPGPIPLYRTLSQIYGPSLVIVMFGKPSPDSCEGLLEAKANGSLTLAFEHSTDLLGEVSRKYADRQIPDDIVTLEQIDRFMNAVLITNKAG